MLRITRAATYAIHALVFMAGPKSGGRPMASHIVARARGIPERFLLKVLKPLVGARVLNSVKGPNGGYRLARTPADISLLDIVEAIDGPIQAPVVPESDQTDAALNRRLNQICSQAADLVKKHLQKVRLTDLVKK